MADNNRPVGRKKTYGNGTGGVHKRGEGLGTGPVGSQNGYNGHGNAGSGYQNLGSQKPSGNGRRMNRAAKGGVPMFVIVIIVALYLMKSCGSGTQMALPESGYSNTVESPSSSQQTTQSSASTQGQEAVDWSQYFGNNAPYSGQSTQAASVSSIASNEGKLDTSVASGSRKKYTQIKGDGTDKVTVMIYMCGADLESKSGMATKDLQEMIAGAPNNMNLIVYTGGARKWNNNVISADVNQVYQLQGSGLKRLEENAGNGAMTDPNTLLKFLQYSKKNFPANRYELVFWNHGGGSVSGYGYDEKNPRSGSMTLDQIKQALEASGMKFDFIGFDACLMATLENGLMLADYADYMIASEETEPGLGWYHTNWVKMLDQDPSVPTVKVGKQIVDDFVNVSAQQCRGQKTTLSVVDLAELSNTVPDKFTAFSKSISDLITQKEYKTVSNARSDAREFATTSVIDQIDLVDLANRIGNEEGAALNEALLGSVKYNLTSRNMTNAYGLSIYFPYRKINMVDKAVQTYNLINLDTSYAKAVQEFAHLEASGQVAAGGSSSASPYGSIFGDLGGNYGSLQDLFGGYTTGGSTSTGSGTSSGSGSASGSGSSASYGGGYSSYGDLFGSGSSSSYGTQEMIGTLIGQFLSNGGLDMLTGLTSSNTGFLSDRELSEQDTIDYITENHFDVTNLEWQKDEKGMYTMALPEDQWSLVHDLDLNVFVDDGEGYIDLGLDNTFGFDENGALIGNTDGTWLAIDDQIVHYQHLDTVGDADDYTITGRVPCLLNGERADLLIVFDSDNEAGYIAGATYEYVNGETDTVAKNIESLQPGDTIQYLCDYYSYDGDFQDAYYLGEEQVVDDDMPITNNKIGSPTKVTYRFTDIYNQAYWTPAIEEK